MQRYVIVLIFDNQLKRIALINKKKNILAGQLNSPGGKIEEGETIIDCAIREVMEEVGLYIKDVTHFLTVKEEKIEGKQEENELNILYAINDNNFTPMRKNTDEEWKVYDIQSDDLSFYNPHLGNNGDIALYIKLALSLIKKE